MTHLTDDQKTQALNLVAAWLGPRMDYDGPAPTGQAAAWSAQGPMLEPAWEPTSGGAARPTILLEGGPHDWAVEASLDAGLVDDLAEIGVHAEPYAGYALCLYALED